MVKWIKVLVLIIIRQNTLTNWSHMHTEKKCNAKNWKGFNVLLEFLCFKFKYKFSLEDHKYKTLM